MTYLRFSSFIQSRYIFLFLFAIYISRVAHYTGMIHHARRPVQGAGRDAKDVDSWENNYEKI